MIIRNSDHKRERIDGVFGGNGSVEFKRIIQTPDELYGKGRYFPSQRLSRAAVSAGIYTRVTASFTASSPARANTATTAA